MADDLAAKIHAIEALKAELDETEAAFAAAEAAYEESHIALQNLFEANERRRESDLRCARWISENYPNATREELEILFERFAVGPRLVH